MQIAKPLPIVLAAICMLHGSLSLADDNVANTIAKAATYIFFPDFAQASVSEAFSEDELAILGEYPEALNSMIRAALGWQDSVCGLQS